MCNAGCVCCGVPHAFRQWVTCAGGLVLQELEDNFLLWLAARTSTRGWLDSLQHAKQQDDRASSLVKSPLNFIDIISPLFLAYTWNGLGVQIAAQLIATCILL